MKKNFVLNIQGFKVSVKLTDEQREKFTELVAVHEQYVYIVLGHPSVLSDKESVPLSLVVEHAIKEGLTLDDALECDLQLWRDIVRRETEERAEVVRDGEEGDVPTRNPSPDEELETLVTVRDASGVVREVTLDEAEEMREAAQGIYNGEPPEPDFEPDAPEQQSETVANAEETLPVVHRGPLMDDKSDFYFALLARQGAGK